MDFPREWTAFGGASLALMGAAICAGASRLAGDHLAWRREWRRAVGAPDAGPGEGRSLIRVFRLGGGLGVLAGLGSVAAAAAGRPLVSPRFGPGDAPLLGACFAALGAGFGALSLSRVSMRRSGEGLAFVAGGLLCLLWIGFGLRLLRAG